MFGCWFPLQFLGDCQSSFLLEIKNKKSFYSSPKLKMAQKCYKILNIFPIFKILSKNIFIWNLSLPRDIPLQSLARFPPSNPQSSCGSSSLLLLLLLLLKVLHLKTRQTARAGVPSPSSPQLSANISRYSASARARINVGSPGISIKEPLHSSLFILTIGSWNAWNIFIDMIIKWIRRVKSVSHWPYNLYYLIIILCKNRSLVKNSCWLHLETSPGYFTRMQAFDKM